MRYLVLPFVLVLCLVELLLRVTAFLLFIVLTFFVIGFAMLDSRWQAVERFLTPVSFDIAKKLAG